LIQRHSNTPAGTLIPNLFHTQDDGLPIHRIVEATAIFLDRLSEEQAQSVQFPLSAPEWRAWSNPEIYMNPFGLRLEEIDEELKAAILKIVEATLSPEGYAKATSAMRINHFLGELLDAPGVLNESSYNFLIFGEPSTTAGWGWSLYGHHLCLNVFLQGAQIVLSPTFIGAEPNMIDEGQYKDTRILLPEEQLGLEFMQTLEPDLQKKAQTYPAMHDPGMPEGRWNLADQRHLCGAFQDNRIVPYEGIKVSQASAKHLQLLLRIVEQFVLYLPEQARRNRLEQVRGCIDDTYFSWIGGYGSDDAFYYRIQSPVIIVEFDHHSGVFLSNEEPAKFHIHTIVRTPNGGDYGYAIRK
jgi:Protein of unknown function (DUF3500)